MTSLALRRWTGLLLIIVPIMFTVCFTLLQTQFEYPDILRQPTADVLTKFAAGGSGLIAVWYVLALTALLFIPVAVLVHTVLMRQKPSIALWLGTIFGIVAGLTQTLGFVRWPFLVPHLAQLYLAPDSSPAQQAAASVVFEAFHRYAGMAIGEHLGYLTTCLWTILIATVIIRDHVFGRWSRWLGGSGIMLALGIGSGLVEPVGWELAGAINAISYLAWAVWLIVLGGVIASGKWQAASSPDIRSALTTA